MAADRKWRPVGPVGRHLRTVQIAFADRILMTEEARDA
jgi:hypothetical protein